MTERQSEGAVQGAHAYCHTCDWYATPDDHDYADVVTAADVHATFQQGHSTTAGFSEVVVDEAHSRAQAGDSGG